MIKFKKNQEIVYDATFSLREKGKTFRFVITKSKITETRKIRDNFLGIVYNVNVNDDIYNLYRIGIDYKGECKIHLLTSNIYCLCTNAMKYILELNK